MYACIEGLTQKVHKKIGSATLLSLKGEYKSRTTREGSGAHVHIHVCTQKTSNWNEPEAPKHSKEFPNRKGKIQLSKISAKKNKKR